MSTSKAHVDRPKWRKRRSPIRHQDDDDCGSLAWLLNFKLDELVNIKVPYDDQVVEEPKLLLPDSPPLPKKPPYTYPELIERALRERGELTVSAIYQWISDRFPYYNANDERWKNSIRHNLSINPHFRKGARAPQGAGHLWSLAANAIDLLPTRNSPAYVTDEKADEMYGHPKIYSDCRLYSEAKIIGCPKVIVLDEAAIAAANILPDNDIFTGSTSLDGDCGAIYCGASLSQLKGSMTVFLNPVSSEQVVRECGLLVVD